MSARSFKNRQCIFSVFAVCFLLLFAVNVCLAQRRITNMRAMLFYQNTGKFSEDVFTVPADLWNVSFDSVYSVFVIVEIEGETQAGDYNRQPQLDFSARYKPLEGANREIIVRKSAPFWFFANLRGKQKLFLGFWIDNIGCDPIRLSANIRGRKTRFQKTINFGCGE